MIIKQKAPFQKQPFLLIEKEFCGNILILWENNREEGNNVETNEIASTKEQKIKFKAPAYKRGIAFLVDAIIAFLPALVMYIIFTGTYTGYTPAFYPAPVIGAVSMIDLPVEVNDSVNTIKTDLGGVSTGHNVSLYATGMRALSVLMIVFYVGYAAFCTVMYDGRTIGKKFMGIRVIPEDGESFNKAILLRELLGKVVINSTVIVPVISIIIMLITKDGKAIHDYIGKTRVVED